MIAAAVNARISTPEEYVLRNEHEREAAEKAVLAYEYAERRWGKEKGRAYLDALSKDGGTVKEAGRAAGVSREMGKRYKKQLKKELKRVLSKKNPKKCSSCAAARLYGKLS